MERRFAKMHSIFKTGLIFIFSYLFFQNILYANSGRVKSIKASCFWLYQENFTIPKDSGKTVDGLKDGKWVEYEFDKEKITLELSRMAAQQGLNVYEFVPLRKETGSYINGKKTGIWTLYKSPKSTSPYEWFIEKETTYENDLKNGREIIYSNLDGKKSRILMDRHWVNDQQSGTGKIYDLNPPYHLQKVYKAVEGKYLLLETYHPNGKLETKFIDSVLAKSPVKYFEHFYKNGKVKQTGFYEKDTVQFGVWNNYYEDGTLQSVENYKNGNIDGAYEFYHKNGQLWTKTIYKDGLLWEIMANYDKEGNKKDKGTLKNGTGLVNIYDENGMLSRTVEYKNGYQVTK